MTTCCLGKAAQCHPHHKMVQRCNVDIHCQTLVNTDPNTASLEGYIVRPASLPRPSAYTMAKAMASTPNPQIKAHVIYNSMPARPA